MCEEGINGQQMIIILRCHIPPRGFEKLFRFRIRYRIMRFRTVRYNYLVHIWMTNEAINVTYALHENYGFHCTEIVRKRKVTFGLS